MTADNGGFGFAGGMRAGASAASAAPAVDAGDLIRDTTTATFSADVLQESRKQPVLVDFWAPWCGPCKQLTPVLEKVIRAAKGRVKLVKMNIDDHPSIAGQLGIQSIPAVIAFKNGQPVDGFMGAVPESQINAFIDRIAGSAPADGPDIAEMMAAAVEAREAGDTAGALDIYGMVLEREPDNVAAVAGMAELLLDAGDSDAARQLLDQLSEAKAKDAAVVALRARMTLDEQVAGLGNPQELEARLTADPKDHQARFDLAMIQNARGDRTAAADSLLAIIKADRAWNDDGARSQLLTLFQAWGMTDDATLAARRKLSSILFS